MFRPCATSCGSSSLSSSYSFSVTSSRDLCLPQSFDEHLPLWSAVDLRVRFPVSEALLPTDAKYGNASFCKISVHLGEIEITLNPPLTAHPIDSRDSVRGVILNSNFNLMKGAAISWQRFPCLPVFIGARCWCLRTPLAASPPSHRKRPMQGRLDGLSGCRVDRPAGTVCQ